MRNGCGGQSWRDNELLRLGRQGFGDLGQLRELLRAVRRGTRHVLQFQFEGCHGDIVLQHFIAAGVHFPGRAVEVDGLLHLAFAYRGFVRVLRVLHDQGQEQLAYPTSTRGVLVVDLAKGRGALLHQRIDGHPRSGAGIVAQHRWEQAGCLVNLLL